MNKVVPLKRYVSSVSPKGQITLPTELRKALGVKPRDKVALALDGDAIRVELMDVSLEGSYQAVPALPSRMSLADVVAVAHEEAAQAVAGEGD